MAEQRYFVDDELAAANLWIVMSRLSNGKFARVDSFTTEAAARELCVKLNAKASG